MNKVKELNSLPLPHPALIGPECKRWPRYPEYKELTHRKLKEHRGRSAPQPSPGLILLVLRLTCHRVVSPARNPPLKTILTAFIDVDSIA